MKNVKKLFGKFFLSCACNLSILLFAAHMNANAQSAGSLDTSFNHTGKVYTSIATNDEAYGIAIQKDGKIVAAGSSYDGTGTSFALTRYNANGTLDNTFGKGGKTTTYLGAEEFGSVAQAVAIQGDGKIVAAGYSNGGSGSFTIIRYKANGIIDSTFGYNGITGNVMSARANAIAIQKDGKIIVAGSYIGNFVLARYSINGSPDNTFGTGSPYAGMVYTTIGSGSTAYAVSIQNNGKIIAAGTSQNGNNSYITLVRYKTDGSIDSTFGTAGIVTTALGTDATAYGISIQSDGKIIIAGSSGLSANAVFAVARYDTTGSLDATFGTGGTVTTVVGTGGGYAHGVSVQKDSKVVAAGFADNYFALARYAANGTLDATFGTGGKVTTDIGGSGKSAQANAVSLQADGNIVVAGYSGVLYSATHFALARYIATSSSGITEYDRELAVNLFPNPAHDRINISSQQNIEETAIIDIMGKEIQVCTYSNTSHVSIIFPVNEGIYFIRIKTQEGTLMRKVIKCM